MDINARMDKIREVGEEILTEEDLKKLLSEKKTPVAYDGFEPSGNIHIAQGLLRAINIGKMLDAGFKFKMLIADWHAAANNKFDGDLEKIRVVGEYYLEVWKACGLDTGKVEFIWASDLVKDSEYWKIVLNVARANTVQRIIRTSQIMGRSESDSLSAAQILYPCMQAADIFYLNADVTELGMDQRKVNVLAREVGEKLGFWKPVVVSHHMLMGLQKPPETDNTVERATAMKMSKSNPNSAIFMTDSEDDIKKKMNKAYCPEKQAEENPVLEYNKHIIFNKFKEVIIERPEKFGGNATYKSYSELETAYLEGNIHPADLKSTTAKYINQLLIPVREHFEKNSKAKKLMEQVKGFQVTR